MKKIFPLVSVIFFTLLTLAIAPCWGSESSYSNLHKDTTPTVSVEEPDTDPIVQKFTTEDPSPKKITL